MPSSSPMSGVASVSRLTAVTEDGTVDGGTSVDSRDMSGM